MKVKEPEYNCLKCDFQGTRQEELDKHIQLKHSSQGMMKCRNCGKEFDRNLVSWCIEKLNIGTQLPSVEINLLDTVIFLVMIAGGTIKKKMNKISNATFVRILLEAEVQS